ncbi:L-asparaginase [Methylobacter tundripaludum]|uniref:L-asparaginase n=1 Tax=Methylobacter tundripaludum TaxID=173365 RepID=A0A2S6HL74_9GAMM|nr:asparaginase domain-containing protein [Methylobacter tundripaludum]PPK78245.1 L-asparaginase [Methylobacter tundripaludum]
MKNILVVFTGGTIGSIATGGTINTSDSTSFELIRQFQQHDENHRQIHFDTIQPLQILSENLAPGAWKTLIAAIEAARPDQYDGIIITHGTDTLAYTACALSFYFNAARIPMLLVSSDYPLENPKANGLENFICAVEFILQTCPESCRRVNRAGVFVPYRNYQQITQLHQGTRLACSLQLSGDFFSVQGKSYLQFENRQFSLLNPPTQQTPPRRIPLKADFSDRILMIKPYPGLDYARFNLDHVDAVLHDLYHSGTAYASPQWGENYSLIEFMKRCEKQGITVYLAPVIKSADAYQSTQALIEQGAKIIWNMSIEAAYVKLLLAYGNFDDKQEIMDFMVEDIAGEHL